jgi:hypothetical protein
MDAIRMVDYFYTMAPDKPGASARLLAHFRDQGVNFLAFTAFPRARKAQVDFVPADTDAFKRAARAGKIELSPRKTVFLIQGEDRVGALAEIAERLAAANINITALDGVATGDDRYGAILWVKPADVRKAAAALGLR